MDSPFPDEFRLQQERLNHDELLRQLEKQKQERPNPPEGHAQMMQDRLADLLADFKEGRIDQGEYNRRYSFLSNML